MSRCQRWPYGSAAATSLDHIYTNSPPSAGRTNRRQSNDFISQLGPRSEFLRLLSEHSRGRLPFPSTTSLAAHPRMTGSCFVIMDVERTRLVGRHCGLYCNMGLGLRNTALTEKIIVESHTDHADTVINKNLIKRTAWNGRREIE